MTYYADRWTWEYFCKYIHDWDGSCQKCRPSSEGEYWLPVPLSVLMGWQYNSMSSNRSSTGPATVLATTTGNAEMVKIEYLATISTLWILVDVYISAAFDNHSPQVLRICHQRSHWGPIDGFVNLKRVLSGPASNARFLISNTPAQKKPTKTKYSVEEHEKIPLVSCRPLGLNFKDNIWWV